MTATLQQVREYFDWTAERSPAEYAVTHSADEGETRLAPRHIVWHSETGGYLGDVSPSYALHQYSETLVDNISTLLDQSDLRVKHYGQFDGGAVGFVQVEFPTTSQRADVEYSTWISAVSSHNGSFATSYLSGNDLITCSNSVRSAVAKANGLIKIRHTRNSQLRVAEAREALGVMFHTDETFGDLVDSMLGVKVTQNDFNRLVREFTKPDGKEGKAATIATNAEDRLHAMWETDTRVAPWHGTGFGAFQAFNTFDLWERPVRGGEREDRNMQRTLAGLDKSASHVQRVLALA
jgi:phage/plasmid-like protein (TIGR03299 family)